MHRLHLDQRKLSEELGVSYYNFGVIIREMAKDGRLRVIGGGRFETKTYLIEDPTVWDKSE